MYRTVYWSALAVVLAVAVTGTALAQMPDGSSPASAIPVSSGPAVGVITGSTGGAYQYFSLQSPSSNCTVTITLSFSPGVEPVGNAIGVVAWQNGSQLGSMNGVSSSPGTNTRTFSPIVAGPVLLQVYSYYPGLAVNYSLDVTVTDFAAPSGPPQSTPTPAPGSASLPATPAQPVAAVLPSNPYGSFAYYQYDYRGDGSLSTLALSVTPNGRDTTNAVFLSVYQSGRLLASQSVGTSPTPGVLVLTYSSSTKAPVLVQIANYNFAKTIAYTLSNSP